MNATKSVLVSVALLVTPFSLQADNSFKDTYQFGTGSQGPLTHEELTLSDTYRFELVSAYDCQTSQADSSERAEMAVLEVQQGSVEPAIPGYIGIY